MSTTELHDSVSRIVVNLSCGKDFIKLLNNWSVQISRGFDSCWDFKDKYIILIKLASNSALT